MLRGLSRSIWRTSIVARYWAYGCSAIFEKNGWLAGEFSVGDIAVASTIRTLSYANWQLDGVAYPKLSAWYARVGARPGWQAAIAIEEQIFKAAGF